MQELSVAVDAYLRSLRSERGLSPRTTQAYASDLSLLLDFCERAGVADPKALTLEVFRDLLWQQTQGGKAASSIARMAASFRGFTSWLDETGRGPDSARRLKSPKAGSTLPRVVSADGMRGILDSLADRAATGDPVEQRDLAIIELLYASGIRVSECCSLDVGAVDLGRRVVRSSVRATRNVLCHSVPTRREPLIAGWSLVAPRSSNLDRVARSFSALAVDDWTSVRCTRCPAKCSGLRQAVALLGRTRSDTLLRRICLMGEQTCGPCRRSWATRISARHRSTRTSRPNVSEPRTCRRIREPRE